MCQDEYCDLYSKTLVLGSIIGCKQREYTARCASENTTGATMWRIERGRQEWIWEHRWELTMTAQGGGSGTEKDLLG